MSLALYLSLLELMYWPGGDTYRVVKAVGVLRAISVIEQTFIYVNALLRVSKYR